MFEFYWQQRTIKYKYTSAASVDQHSKFAWPTQSNCWVGNSQAKYPIMWISHAKNGRTKMYIFRCIVVPLAKYSGCSSLPHTSTSHLLLPHTCYNSTSHSLTIMMTRKLFLRLSSFIGTVKRLFSAKALIKIQTYTYTYQIIIIMIIIIILLINNNFKKGKQ